MSMNPRSLPFAGSGESSKSSCWVKNRSKSLFLDSHSICRITTSQLKEQEVANEHESQGACPLPVQEKAPRAVAG